ncbi:endonuclease Q family protein [Bacillus sp. DTU_2020_1000418_1_SI_GHA_SEK_038]|uniref:endonuclease Q family protein n=1 Tax=Bacillus sp. DTU_2020_1000418_1_SI_GHA_SEK_038 TaxID=3077585 RepID=UPI0028EFF52A|nr:endonuclease Q family protein [Bacillus sp. DTU_2020_1000418_1_SI_GHA_SEK_038]WNS74110.1 endonuclease Q family protein [Bacillus sp. DTU_2020_1000418_1_SI_GHA_SEK_038]
MKDYYSDLHIHIGRTMTGKPVKITGAKSLTFTNIIEHARNEKGLNMIGIIDCHSPEVILEIAQLMETGDVTEHQEGGLQYGDLTIIPGSELEIYDENCQGPIHVLCYFPTLTIMKEFSYWLSNHLKNITLSSQRIYASGRGLQTKVKELGGLFIPAHVFTPFKSLYGKGVHRSLEEVFDKDQIDAIELGLSADTAMADQIKELHNYSFLTNSDAHSLKKIAREYHVLQMAEPSFLELERALKGEDGRRIKANYGLDPLLGKYHQTVCSQCFAPFDPIINECENCGSIKYIKGVADRITELKTSNELPDNRPPYVHQVPLEFIPGLGPKMLQKLLDHFGTEMAILHEVPLEKLSEIIPAKTADLIVKAREGKLSLSAGGGGKYGKISD